MSIKAFDAVNTNFFDNYFFLDGISNHLGYKKYEPVYLQGNQYTLREAEPQSCNFFSTLLKIASYCTVIIPVIMLVGKMIFRLQNDFALQDLAPKPPVTEEEALPPPGTEQQTKAGDSFTVGTYNILFPQSPQFNPKFSSLVGYTKDGSGNLRENSAFRTGIIIENLKNADLDIVCLQELNPVIALKIENAPGLKDKYYFSCQMHPFPNPPLQNGVGIAFKTDRFEKISGEDHTILGKRVHSIFNLKDKTTQKTIRVASCHLLDFKYNPNMDGQHTQEVVDTVLASDADYTIIAGDMNADEKGLPPNKASVAFKPLLDKGFNVDENRDSSEFTKDARDNIVPKNRRIDWIWVKDKTPKHLPLPNFDLYGSDHRLVAVTIG